MAAGITTNTLQRRIFNLAGYLTAGATDVALGAYEDAVFTPEFEYEEFTPAGTWGPLAGGDVITMAGGTLEVTMHEAHYANLQIIMGDMAASDSGASEQFGGSDFATSANLFRPVVANVVFNTFNRGGSSGLQAGKIVFSNAVVTPPPLELGKVHGGFKVKFEARYAVASPSTNPVTIYIAKPAS